ncbi:S-adenosyl-L-methionine-dependent methyltransferases superfamily protein [Tasmannia lanceolata]|uniref:S-adenosyl-L-methionine-dependent methyltransferases superfamily protein n=1 Tax=Tasmannia lanceolata TaxID=3420 RepID=UPI00406303AF
MERNVQSLLNRISFASITFATITLFFLFSHSPTTPCQSPHQTLIIRFPKSSCEANHREHLPHEKRTRRLWSTRDWRKKVDSYTDFFQILRNIGLLNNNSNVLCVSAGAGHEVMALIEMGVVDVTGVEVVDWPPLVSRADPHDLPFFDGVFDLGFSAHLAESLFPTRFVAELERTVRPGGISVLALEEWVEVGEIRDLFRKSSSVGARNVTLMGSKMTQIIMRNGIPP